MRAGAKGRRTKTELEKGLKDGARSGPNQEGVNNGRQLVSDGGGGGEAAVGRHRRGEAGPFADLLTESDVRDVDGNGRGGRELPASAESGDTQSGGGRN